MKLRLLPILVSFIVSIVLLFGGWFAYRSLAMENPLTKKVDEIPGVINTQFDFNSSQISVDLKLSSDANIRKIYESVVEDTSSILGKRILNVQISNPSSDVLDEWWSNALFEVAQAMDSGRYSDVPKVLKQQAKQLRGLQVQTEMDENNVYVRLLYGHASKFIILPRQPAKIGVWSP